MGNVEYILVPYTHKNPRVRQWRVDTAAMYCAARRNHGCHPYCAIVECHLVEAFMDGDRGDFSNWETYNRRMMQRCNSAIILPLPGWDKSIGITGECIYWMNELQRDEPIVAYQWAAYITANL